jgi:hypothetical protein
MSRYKLVFFVPASARVAVQSAIFATGAGTYPGGKYSECAWHSHGTGQFRPGDGAKPKIGEVGTLEEVEECRVEILCVGGEEGVRKAVGALKGFVAPLFSFLNFFCAPRSRGPWEFADRCYVPFVYRTHPYEVPAYEVYKLEDF